MEPKLLFLCAVFTALAGKPIAAAVVVAAAYLWTKCTK